MERDAYIEFVEQFVATLRSRRRGRLQTQQYQQDGPMAVRGAGGSIDLNILYPGITP